MKTNDNNIQIIVKVLQEKLGIRLIKQIFCVLLLIFEIEEKKIMSELGISYNTVKKYSNMIKTGTLAELFVDNTYKNKSELENYTGVILKELEQNPARTLREAAIIIEKVTGIKRSIPQVRNFLKKMDTDH